MGKTGVGVQYRAACGLKSAYILGLGGHQLGESLHNCPVWSDLVQGGWARLGRLAVQTGRRRSRAQPKTLEL